MAWEAAEMISCDSVAVAAVCPSAASRVSKAATGLGERSSGLASKKRSRQRRLVSAGSPAIELASIGTLFGRWGISILQSSSRGERLQQKDRTDKDAGS
jgi:hypothetical protein